jgi:hypothetical protein
MLRTGLILLLIFCLKFIQAQDTIYFVNKEKLPVLIKEIGTTTVTYKRFDNPEGPNYVYEKSEIYLIKYLNGQTDTISPFYRKESVQNNEAFVTYDRPVRRTKVVYEEPPSVPVDSNALRFYKGWLYKGYTEISIKQFIFLTDSMASKKQLTELKRISDKVGLNHSRQKTFGFSAIPVALVGVGLLGIAALEYRLSSGTSDVSGINIAAAAFGAVGLGMEITSIINGFKKKSNMKKAMIFYNQNL